MALVARWRRADTIMEFEAALRSRIRDAECLRRSRRAYWAVYTRGYVAEMLLKSAYFRFMGHPLTGSLVPQLNKTRLQSRAVQVGAATAVRNLHDLVFWADLLVYERISQNRPLPVALANRLVAEVRTVAKNWTESMRYWRSTAAPEVNAVENAVRWLTSNHSQLWS